MTTTLTTDAATAAVTAYLAAWNATGDERGAAVAAAVDPDVRYVDPLADVKGSAAFEQVIAGVQEQFSGMRISLVGGIDVHHDVCRFQWGLGPEGAEPLVIGFDVAVVSDDGRIGSVYGFLDKIPG